MNKSINPYGPPSANDQSEYSAPNMKRPPKTGLRRLARLLFWAPFLIAIAVFIYVDATTFIPTPLLRIEDRFRQVKLFFSITLPMTAGCWCLAMAITAIVDIPLVPRSRKIFWLVSLGLLILLTIIIAALEL